MMRFSIRRLSRRQAIGAIAAATTPGLRATGSETRTASLIGLSKNNAKELLLKLGLSRNYVFVLWRQGLMKPPSRLACYSLDGVEQWSEDLGSSHLLEIVGAGDDQVQAIFLDQRASQVTFAKYSGIGPLHQRDQLTYTGGVVCTSASTDCICILDMSLNVLSKAFRGSRIHQIATGLDRPTIGGLVPPSIAASMHFLGVDLLVLDHMKARTVMIGQDRKCRTGRLVHPMIEAALAVQDSETEERLAQLRRIGRPESITFPTSIIFAASDQAGGLWAVPKSLNPRKVALFRVDSSLSMTASCDIVIPDAPMLQGKPPLMLAASESMLALGFRDGVVALARPTEAL